MRSTEGCSTRRWERSWPVDRGVPARFRLPIVRCRPRRGVLLLVLLCMLFLFAAMGVTFVLTAGQFRKGTSRHHRLEHCAVDYRNQLNDAAMQIFRGSNNPTSVLTIHSLLEDYYGNDSISYAQSKNVTISAAASSFGSGGTTQLVDLTLSRMLTWPTWQYYTGSTISTPQPPSQPLGGPPPFSSLLPPGNAPSGFFNGCLLTFVTGPAAGQTTRIVGYDCGTDPSGNGNTVKAPTLRVMGFPGAAALIAQSTAPPGHSPMVQFLINGRPFNGTGFGFNPPTNATNNTALVDATDAPQGSTPVGHLYALLPNPVFFDPTANTMYATPGGIGGADEDYDAADWNNMLLGLPLDPRDVGNPSPSLPPYPSLHRPELVSYWQNNPGSSPPSLRQYMLRPFGVAVPNVASGVAPDHPNFTGSNPNPNGFDPINGPWDVDNDGDGVTDSVWVDLGMPVQAAADGTVYKPLFAIRVLDLDGRLNVNAHGNSAQTESTYAQAVSSYFATGTGASAPTSLAPNPVMPISTAPNPSAPQVSSGYGTADVNLLPIFMMPPGSGTTTAAAVSQYQTFLAGTGGSGGGGALEGRYGESNYGANLPYAITTAANARALPPESGVTNVALTNYANAPTGSTPGNPLALVKHWGLPIPGFPSIPTAYGSAPDLWGRGFVALDVAGTPMNPGMSSEFYAAAQLATAAVSGNSSTGSAPSGSYDTLNNPYAMNLSRRIVRASQVSGAVDNPFTPAELERLLRVYDLDCGSLAPRLSTLIDPTSGATPLGASGAIAALRRQVTTDSYDPPCPNVLSPTTNTSHPTANNFRAEYPVLLNPATLFYGGMLQASPPMSSGHVPAQLSLMLPPDLMNGQRLDINRLFGNGLDDDQDGVVDEPDEYGADSTNPVFEPAWVSGSASAPWMSGGGVSPFPSEGSTPVKLAIDWNHDGTIDSKDAVFVRQQTARYLYLLAMNLIDPWMLGTGGSPSHRSAAIQYDADAGRRCRSRIPIKSNSRSPNGRSIASIFAIAIRP